MRVKCDRLTVLIVIRGTWSDSEPERLLRAVFKFARKQQNVFTGHILEDGANQMKLLDNLKKEFRLNRIYWRQIFDRWDLGIIIQSVYKYILLPVSQCCWCGRAEHVHHEAEAAAA